STEEIPDLEQVIGQERAVRALSFGLDISSPGYHTFALGPVGTGKATVIKRLLERQARQRPAPDDWCYVNNFDDQEKPRAIRLPAGRGCELRDAMDRLVEELQVEIPRAFEGEQYQKESERIQSELQKSQARVIQELNEATEKERFRLVQTPQGLALVPVKDGEVVGPDEFKELPEEERERLEAKQEELQKDVMTTVRDIQRRQRETKDRMRELDRQVVEFAVAHLVTEVEEQFADHPKVLDFISSVRSDILDQVEQLKSLRQSEEAQQQQLPMALMAGANQKPGFDHYRVNLVVDNCDTEGAPVIRERNPTEQNLVGRVEHEARFGALTTSFRMLRSGALHRANGGFLLVEARDLLLRPFAWPTLKRALKNRLVKIESMMDDLRVITTRTLEPEPIPLDVKVVLTGDPMLYYMLYNLDDEFRELFKVKADFAVDTGWDDDVLGQYARFVARACREEGLRHFDRSAVARLVEHSSRRAADREKLATKFDELLDVVRESAYWSNHNGAELVTAEDVERAIDEKIHRSNRIEERLREMIDNGTLLIDTTGEVVGQVNGLSVMALGDYAFGRPTRITARSHLGSAGVVHIDREIKLGGRIHNKGALILAGYLGGHFASEVPLALSASLTFEQSYQEIEGDSASSAELYALLSSLSNLPLRQDIAVTGSVNQQGQIQAIGGVNEKIEGYFEVCRTRGLTGVQGVMIPQSNVRNLMLRSEVVEAVRNGLFHVWAASTVDEGISLLTGRPAGSRGDDGEFPEGTVNHAVESRLRELARRGRQYAKLGVEELTESSKAGAAAKGGG
ncbi:MAG TPA: ATP-binding protein, partial [Chondromyces sp.]|nr:ATP-binding protein [Chondromyces sp.]